MANMVNMEKAIGLIQSAINLLDASERWEDMAHLKAQTLGLQGEKRRERDEARKDHILVQYLQSVSVDVFDRELIPQGDKVNFPPVPDFPTYFNVYLNKLWDTYNELHKIANELVVIGFKPIAEPLYCHIECLFCYIIETKRTIKEGKLAKWDFIFLSRYQVESRNVHDEFEGKEEKTGYNL